MEICRPRFFPFLFWEPFVGSAIHSSCANVNKSFIIPPLMRCLLIAVVFLPAGRRGPVFPELVGARGMSLPDPDRPSSRFPGVPYLSRSRNPLSPLDKVDPEEMKRQRLLESKGKALIEGFIS